MIETHIDVDPFYRSGDTSEGEEGASREELTELEQQRRFMREALCSPADETEDNGFGEPHDEVHALEGTGEFEVKEVCPLPENTGYSTLHLRVLRTCAHQCSRSIISTLSTPQQQTCASYWAGAITECWPRWSRGHFRFILQRRTRGLVLTFCPPCAAACRYGSGAAG